jgi:hypothetical protein
MNQKPPIYLLCDVNPHAEASTPRSLCRLTQSLPQSPTAPSSPALRSRACERRRPDPWGHLWRVIRGITVIAISMIGPFEVDLDLESIGTGDLNNTANPLPRLCSQSCSQGSTFERTSADVGALA